MLIKDRTKKSALPYDPKCFGTTVKERIMFRVRGLVQDKYNLVVVTRTFGGGIFSIFHNLKKILL